MSLGFSVMLNQLMGGNESAEAFKGAIGKTIAAATLADDILVLRFDDGTGIRLRDDGQSCCEKRYMVCDDDLSGFIGSKLVGGEIRQAPDVARGEDDWCDHEVQFLVLHTDGGDIVCSNHNEHNGYYGGFSVQAESI